MPEIGYVKHPPKDKPLMIYDGECYFCCRWIERWKKITKDQVNYKRYQELEGQFPEIPVTEYENAVCLIDPNGKVTSGALAVFQTLATDPKHRWLLWLYRIFPPFRFLMEWKYRLVAKNRVFFSRLERTFGLVGERRSYQLTQWLFLRGLGLVYLAAFISIGSQILGLAGSGGIIPVQDYLEAIQKEIGWQRFWAFPTLSWISASDVFLMIQCALGVIGSLLVLCGIFTGWALILLWVLYLSISVACGVFFNFQWDALLLEVGFLACFFAPFAWFHQIRPEREPSRVLIWLYRWLLFRLTFASGAVKLLSQDPTWQNLTALKYHYETQPLPTTFSWYLHQLPEAFHIISAGGMFMIELFIPFLIFMTRRLRFVACLAITLLMLGIGLTGNYCFFNLLTIVLCILLLDDDYWPAKWKTWLTSTSPFKMTRFRALTRQSVIAVLAVVVLSVTVMNFSAQMRWKSDWPRPIRKLGYVLSPFNIFNHYGLFAVMTTARPEIIIEGSYDGEEWKEYGFKYKPGDLKRRPRFNFPHQPRLDWQMWFAALGTYQRNPWLVHFCKRLLQGSPEVLKLLEDNPFPEKPPKYIRAIVYDYHFSSPEEKRKSGQWWTRSEARPYLPVLALAENEEVL